MTTSAAFRRDARALGIWFGAFALVWFVLVATVLASGAPVTPELLAAFWRRWDFIHFDDIAKYGYLPAAGVATTAAPLTAFFPALPAVMAFGAVLGVPTIATALAVSAVGGAVATVFVARIAEDRRPGAGVAAAAVFVLVPTAIFMFAPYTEALFLGFAVPAWYFASRDRWAAASLLAAGAALTRISGVFLVAALLVMWGSQHLAEVRSYPRRLWEAAWLVVPIAAVAAWMGVLWAMTGHPLEYLRAQEYWGRDFSDPVTAVVNTWTAYAPTPDPAMRSLEIAAFAVGVGSTVVFAIRRRYASAVWIGLSVLALGTSTYLYSVPRSSLLWWPLWIAIGVWLSSRRWMLLVYLVLSAAVMCWWTALFFSGAWAG